MECVLDIIETKFKIRKYLDVATDDPEYALKTWTKLTTTQDEELKRELNKITNFDFSNLGLHSLPPEIGDLVQVKIINFSNNHLISLPKELSKLTNLQKLDCSKNKLSLIPQNIGKMTSLRSLDLSTNLLKKLPSSVEKLTQLETLNLSRNPIYEFPDSLLPVILVDFRMQKYLSDSTTILSRRTHSALANDKPGKKKIYFGNLNK